MQRFLTDRFEVAKVVRRTKAAISFVGHDRWSGKRNVFVKCLVAGTFQVSSQTAQKLAAFRGLKHPLLTNVDAVGFTPRRDFYAIRPYLDSTALLNGIQSSLIGQIIAACSVLQSAGMVHGRIKPSNILVQDDSIQLVDSGLPGQAERALDREAVSFMAPEVLAGTDLRPESDLYSLGALLYRIYANRHLFEDQDTALLKEKHANAMPIPLCETADVPQEFSDVIMRLVDRDLVGRKQAFSRLLSIEKVKHSPATRAVFLGRNALLEEASNLLRKPDGGIHIIALEGVPGSGKTRLIEELSFRAELHNHQLLVGRSYERENRRFEPILQAIEQWFRRNHRAQSWLETDGRSFVPTVARLLPNLPHPDSPIPNSEFTAEQLVADLVGTLVSWSNTDTPISVALEDLHWADDGTLQVLKQLSLRAAESCLPMIVTFRTHQLSQSVVRLLSDLQHSRAILNRVSLPPLNITETRQMAQSLATGSNTHAWIVENSGGNPLLVEECARYREARSTQLLPRIQDVLVAQVKGLPAHLRTAAEALSLFPKPVSLELAYKTLSTLADGHDRQIVTELNASGIFVEHDQQIEFRHDGIRKSVYRNIRPGRRKELHRTVYRMLTAVDSDCESTAFHAEQGGMLDVALSAFEKAGARRQEDGDYGRAAELYSAGRKLYKRLGRSVPGDLDLCCAQSLVQAGQVRKARKILKNALDRVPTHSQIKANMYLTLGSCSWGQPDKAVQYFELARAHSPDGSPDGPRSVLRLAHAYVLAGRTREAESTLKRFELLPQDPSQTDFMWYEDLKALILISLHRYAEALSIMGGKDPKDAFLPQVLVNRSVCLDKLGRLNEAVLYQRNALTLSRQRGLLFGELVCLQNQGATETKMGCFQDAQDCFLEAERIGEVIRISREGERHSIPTLAADHAFLRLEMGEYDKARKLIMSGYRKLKGPRGSSSAVWLAFEATEVYGTIGQPHRARKAIENVATSELIQSKFLVVRRAISLEWTNEVSGDEQLDSLNTALELTAEMGTLYQRVRVLISLAQLNIQRREWKKAADELSEAQALARKCEFGALRPRIALLKAAVAEDDKSRLRYLTAAYRMAHGLPLPEVEAEARFRIANIKLGGGDFVEAHRYLSDSVRTIFKLANQIPKQGRNRYLNVPWRKEARNMLQQVGEKTRADEEHQATDPKRSATYFKTIYEVSMALGKVSGINDFAEVLRGSMSGTLKRGFAIYLTVRDKDEFYEKKIKVDATVAKRISKLYKRCHEHPFFGDHELRPTNEPGAAHIVWIPLTCRHVQFGGIYIDLSDRPPSESEMEFLAALGVIASNTLAATLWASQARPKPNAAKPKYDGIIGSSREIEEVYNLIKIASGSDATVLIEGESGTGKELVARAIHENSARSNKPFITVDCGAIPETLIESELFGSRRGAFTGATADRAGLVAAANGGTLFLDEISNTSPSLQVKFLRVLQEREVRRVGDTRGRHVDLRLVAATNANLEDCVQKGEFRQDLLYRLNVLYVPIPPLRHRRDDILDIARSFLDRLNSTHKTRKRFGRRALDLLVAGTYRGNVRELRNVVERGYFMTTDSATIKQLHVDTAASDGADKNEILLLFEDLKEGRKDFWDAVHIPFKKRDISRETVIALMDLALRETRGTYKLTSPLLGVKASKHRKFIDFLHRNHCKPDFRPYRNLPEA